MLKEYGAKCRILMVFYYLFRINLMRSIHPLANLLFFYMLLIICACNAEQESVDAFQVKILYPLSGLGDRSFADSLYEGVVKAGLHVNFEKTEIMSNDADEAKKTYTSWIQNQAENTELIIAAGVDYAGFITESGCELNNRKLLYMDYKLEQCDNIRNVIYKTYAPSFLAGVAAMEVSQTGKAAIIGGMDIDPVNEFIEGFKAGVEYAGGTITETRYISQNNDGFWSAEKAKEIAMELYEEVDVIFPVAGGSNTGVFEATKAEDGRYTFGIDSDQSFWGKTVILGSVVKHLDLSVEEAITDFADDTLETGIFYMGIEEGKTDFLLNDYFAHLKPVIDAAYLKAVEKEKKTFKGK